MTSRHSSEVEMKMKGYLLSTAEILYWMPDHPSLLQSFIWQHYDIAPQYPELQKFLYFWETNIEGKLHSVRVARDRLIKPSEFKTVDMELRVH